MWRFALSIFNFGAAKISIYHSLELPHWLDQPGTVVASRQSPKN